MTVVDFNVPGGVDGIVVGVGLHIAAVDEQAVLALHGLAVGAAAGLGAVALHMAAVDHDVALDFDALGQTLPGVVAAAPAGESSGSGVYRCAAGLYGNEDETVGIADIAHPQAVVAYDAATTRACAGALERAGLEHNVPVCVEAGGGEAIGAGGAATHGGEARRTGGGDDAATVLGVVAVALDGTPAGVSRNGAAADIDVRIALETGGHVAVVGAARDQILGAGAHGRQVQRAARDGDVAVCVDGLAAGIAGRAGHGDVAACHDKVAARFDAGAVGKLHPRGGGFAHVCARGVHGDGAAVDAQGLPALDGFALVTGSRDGDGAAIDGHDAVAFDALGIVARHIDVDFAVVDFDEAVVTVNAVAQGAGNGHRAPVYNNIVAVQTVRYRRCGHKMAAVEDDVVIAGNGVFGVSGHGEGAASVEINLSLAVKGGFVRAVCAVAHEIG